MGKRASPQKTLYQQYVVTLAANFNEKSAMKRAYQETPFVTNEAAVDPLKSLARLAAYWTTFDV